MISYYTGSRRKNGDAHMFVDGEPLPLRLDLQRHSPDGFEWGYMGSGPAQTALAILAHHLKNDALAVELHQHYHHEVVARAARQLWSTNTNEIDVWLGKQLARPDHLEIRRMS